jgi:beta-lactamase regulating signal transducer with metallopeptidase domain
VVAGPEIWLSELLSLQHCFICTSQLWLEDRDNEDAENSTAIQTARKLVTLARSIPEDQMKIVDIYVCMVLIWAGRVLIKELKRLSILTEDYLST